MIERINLFVKTLIIVLLLIFTFFILFYGVFLYSKYLEIQSNLDYESAIFANKKIIELDTHLSHVAKKINIIEKLTTTNSSNNLHKTQHNLKHITNQFIAFMTDNEIYQMRYVDLDGKELVKVTRKVDDLSVNKDMHNKSDRYYFLESKQLQENEIYISKLDLNIEHNAIETPWKSVLRFVKPIFNKKTKVGYIIINYNMNNFLSSIKSKNLNIHSILLNKDGYYLSGLKKDDEFGFMFNKQNLNFQNDYPDAWKVIQESKSSNINYNKYRGVFKKYNPVETVSPNRSFVNNIEWIIITFYNEAKIIENLKNEFMDNINIFIFTILILIFFSYLITRFIIQLKRKEKELISQSNLAQMGEMINMIAHQWRQPLSTITAIVTDLDIKMSLYGKVDNEILNKHLNDISNTALHLSHTIDDFRNFYKSSNTSKASTIGSIVHKSVKIVDDIYKAQKISLIVKHKNENLTVFINERELMQVILNLLSNSKDALCENKVSNPEIILRTKNDAKYFYIEVEDNGGGIPKKIINKIFDPYFSTKGKNGTGIGLYMVHLIVTRMHGTVNVTNTQNGALFTIKLPING